MDLSEYGITRNEIEGSLNYAIVTIVIGIGVITALGTTLGFKDVAFDWVWIILYASVSVPLQEFIFRGVLQKALYRIGTARAIFITSAVYGLIHYPDPLLIVLTFAAGLAWGYSYYKHPNLLGPVISHAVLGLFLFLLVL